MTGSETLIHRIIIAACENLEMCRMGDLVGILTHTHTHTHIDASDGTAADVWLRWVLAVRSLSQVVQQKPQVELPMICGLSK
jgi:hypothetical protein